MLLSSTQRIPVLVLSCVFHRNNIIVEESTLPSLDVADKLKLLDINNPWQVRKLSSFKIHYIILQVRTLNVNTFDGLEDGFDWILATANNM